MANLTVTIDDDVLRLARIRALEQGTSVNAAVRSFLQAFAGQDERRQAMTRFLDRAMASGSGSAGASWTRDELHDRAALR
ncbi:hypothetical protein [Euzebya tangerina]|uniref:hypothetical protein n=1 Tax=Euzebya tangerina TaxID=591198 RepID=UPI000E31BA96|nr:hypothetical protein [Euzebya tangerina]